MNKAWLFTELKCFWVKPQFLRKPLQSKSKYPQNCVFIAMRTIHWTSLRVLWSQYYAIDSDEVFDELLSKAPL